MKQKQNKFFYYTKVYRDDGELSSNMGRVTLYEDEGVAKTECQKYEVVKEVVLVLTV